MTRTKTPTSGHHWRDAQVPAAAGGDRPAPDGHCRCDTHARFAVRGRSTPHPERGSLSRLTRGELRATNHTATLQPVISAATQGATRQHGADHHTIINLLLKSYA